MADVRGAGGLIERNVVGTAIKYDGKLEKGVKQADGTVKDVQRPDYFLVDAQLDMRDPKTKAGKNTNPHLESHSFKPEDGGTRVAHGRCYTVGQMAKIQEAGQFRTLKDGAIEFAVKGDLMVKQSKDGSHSIIVRTDRPLGKSDFKLTAKTMEGQNKLTAEAKQADAATRAAEKTEQAQAGAAAPEASAEAEMGE